MWAFFLCIFPKAINTSFGFNKVMDYFFRKGEGIRFVSLLRVQGSLVSLSEESLNTQSRLTMPENSQGCRWGGSCPVHVASKLVLAY